VSPIEYVRNGLPPVMMIHGDADPVAPYQQTVRLKAALDKAGGAK
jgi:dipeptidyl aminopeptidase/acylaminoacyl peptidase